MIEFQTEHLRIRPLKMEDLDTMYEYAGDAEHILYMLDFPSSLEETKCYIQKWLEEEKKEEPSFYEFAIEWNGKHIGGVGLYLEKNESDGEVEGELGWFLNKNYCGHGYATEAARVMVEFAKALGLNKVMARCDWRNEVSQKVMRKLGMTLEDDSHMRRNKRAVEPSRELKYSMLIKP